MTYAFAKPRITKKNGGLEIREDGSDRVQLTYSSQNRSEIYLPVGALANLALLLIDFAEDCIRRDAAFERFKAAMVEEEPVS